MLLSRKIHVRLWLSFGFFALVFLVLVAIYSMVGYVTHPNLALRYTDILNVTSCRPQTYIVFIKVHKTGSTSVMNILQRYGLARNLTFILPLVNNYLGKGTTLHLSSRILVPRDNRAINILCNHVVYNRLAFRTALNGRRMVREHMREETERSCNRNSFVKSSENAKKRRCASQMDTNRSTIDINDYTLFTMIRRPLSQVLSTAFYYKVFPGVPTARLMEAILQKPNLFTNNRMSFDLGLPSSHFHKPTKVQEFLNGIDTDFHIVLLMEYFDESMVLLRRRLCWQTVDILYIQRNTGGGRPRMLVTGEQQERFHKEMASADSALYDYFRPRFWRAVHAEGSDFFNEVHHYRSLLSLVRDYCSYIQYQQFDPSAVRADGFNRDGLNQTEWVGENNDNPLRIAASQWHSEFSIGTDACNIMTMDELPLVERIRKLQYGDRWGSKHKL